MEALGLKKKRLFFFFWLAAKEKSLLKALPRNYFLRHWQPTRGVCVCASTQPTNSSSAAGSLLANRPADVVQHIWGNPRVYGYLRIRSSEMSCLLSPPLRGEAAAWQGAQLVQPTVGPAAGLINSLSSPPLSLPLQGTLNKWDHAFQALQLRFARDSWILDH